MSPVTPLGLVSTVSASESVDSVDSLEDQRALFMVELEKDKSGLGLTVAGYICEKGRTFDLN